MTLTLARVVRPRRAVEREAPMLDGLEAFAFPASFLMFPMAMAYYGIPGTAALLWLPVVVAATFAVGIGIAWPAALLGVWFPTARIFASQALRILFFAAPGVLALAQVPDHVRP
jgi:ABC-type polysaccharide/polyol phosphate export permease